MQVEIVFAFWKMSLFCLCNQMMIQGEPTKMVSFCLSLSFSWCGFYFPPLDRSSWLILTGMGAYLPTLLPTTAFQNEQCEWCYRHFSVWKPSLLEEKRKKSFCTWTFSESFTTCRASSGYWLESRSFPMQFGGLRVEAECSVLVNNVTGSFCAPPWYVALPLWAFAWFHCLLTPMILRKCIILH